MVTWIFKINFLHFVLELYIILFLLECCHHQSFLIAQIPLTLSCHPSLSVIALGKSSQCLHTELMNLSFCWLANIGRSIRMFWIFIAPVTFYFCLYFFIVKSCVKFFCLEFLVKILIFVLTFIIFLSYVYIVH